MEEQPTHQDEIEEANQKRVLHPYLCWIAGGLGVIVAPKFVATCKHLIPQELFEDGTATKVKRDIDGLEFDGFVRIARSDYDFILIETNDRICEETQAPELQINVKQGARYIITGYEFSRLPKMRSQLVCLRGRISTTCLDSLDEHPLHCYHWGGSGARAGYSGAPVYRHFDCASDSTFQRPRLIGIVIGGVPNVPPLDSANAITKRITERNEVQIFPAKWIYHFMKLFQLVKAPELQINPMYNEIKNNPIDPFGKIFMRCEVPHPNKETLFDQTSVFRRPHISQKKPAVTNFPLNSQGRKCVSWEDGPSTSELYDAQEKIENPDELSTLVSIFSFDGKPFSLVNRKILTEYFDRSEELFDEFGFELANTESEQRNNDPTAEKPPIECSSHRMKWLAHIHSTYDLVEEDLIWKKMNIVKVRDSSKFNKMLKDEGIPHSLRPFLWPSLSGGLEKRKKSNYSYMDIVTKSEDVSSTTDLQIDKDLLRSLTNNYCFSKADYPGVLAMRRILKAITFLYPDVGYCQGMGVVVASLLLVCFEEHVFWIICSLIEDILPANFYNHSLLGLRADELIVKHLMQIHMPNLIELINQLQLDITTISANWLLTLFASVFSPRTLFRVWDLLFSCGSSMMFRIIISILKMNEERLLEHQLMKTATDLHTMIAKLPSEITSEAHLLEMIRSFEFSITDHLIAELRKEYQGILMAESGLIEPSSNGTNLTIQQVKRRDLVRSRNIIQQFFNKKSAYSTPEELDPKMKNIRQTELIIDLRNAIYQVCKQFSQCSENHERVVLSQADYSLSDETDRTEFIKGRREGKKRARALLDFEKSDDDDLGFLKNDVLSEKDENRWTGELNGEKGLFPTKFVELVRGPLALAFKQILCHGLKKPNGIASSFFHPWQFIESLAAVMVDKKQSSSSRLSLSTTDLLDQDRKVLSPEELLCIAVQTINRSHNAANASLDTKLRSLVAFALNEQCLHIWFNILCSYPNQEALRKNYFFSWSFIRSPAAPQIKSELRLLAQFSFNLNINTEIGGRDSVSR